MKKDLWLRLKHYHFDHLVPPHLTDHVMAVFSGDDASTKAFASKLSRKLHWSGRNSRRAIEEYRKFCYLGMVSDFGVTPSKIIDQVWHEHLLFTRGYREFCVEVLQRDFDHNPELVGTPEQTGVFEAQYAATLDLYEREFHMAPPDDIWGVTKFRKTALATAPVKKKAIDDRPPTLVDDTPLYAYFDGSLSTGGDSSSSSSDMAEFGGGGGFSGGGGGSSWGEDSSHDGGSSSDSSDGGSDSGSSSDSGGSSCSSSCGGGGCGGGGD